MENDNDYSPVQISAVVRCFVGSRVSVRWKGDWYDGQVIKLGPKRNLCRVSEVES